MRAPGVSDFTGLHSSRPNRYVEYRQTVDDLDRALGSLEHIAGVLSAAGKGAHALCRAVVDAAAEHLGEPWAVLALSGTALPLARPRMLGRGPSGVAVSHPALLPEVVRRPVVEALAADAVEPWQNADGAVAVPLVVDGEPIGALVACGGSRRTATAADLAILRIVASQSAVALLSDHLLAWSEELRRQAEELSAQAGQRARDLADRRYQLADAERRPDVAAQRGAVVRSLAAPAPSAVAAGPDLTAREREVLTLLARGLSNEAIGEELYISATTAKFHVGNVMRKLAVSRRAEAVYAGSKLGLI